MEIPQWKELKYATITGIGEYLSQQSMSAPKKMEAPKPVRGDVEDQESTTLLKSASSKGAYQCSPFCDFGVPFLVEKMRRFGVQILKLQFLSPSVLTAC